MVSLDPTSPLSSLAGGLSATLENAATSLVGSGGNTGSRTYYNGLPLMLRNSRYATVINKANSTIQAMPRQKFLFYATFNPSSALTGVKDFSSWQSGFAFQISKIDRPKFTIDVKQVNQYNRKRLVQTGIEYDPVSITLHDTVDDRVLRVWQSYYQWYFGDGRSKNSTVWNSNVIENTFSLSSGWGFSPPNTSMSNTNFFESLDIYTFYGKKYTQVRMWNPKITSIEFDGMDTESSAFAVSNMSVKHEGVSYMATAQALTDDLITKFNLNSGDYYEPSDLFGGVNTFLLDLNDGLQSSIDTLLNGVQGIPFVGQALSNAGSKLISANGVTSFLPNIAQNISASSLTKWGQF